MAQQLNTEECQLLLSGYTRCNYSEVIPEVLISLLTKFFNLWQHVRVTTNSITKFCNLDENQYSIIPLPAVSYHDELFRCRLVCYNIGNSSSNLPIGQALFLQIALPEDIEHIGGWFRIAADDEHNYYTYKRLEQEKVDDEDAVQWVVAANLCGPAILFRDFSYLIEIRQMKYSKFSEFDDVDTLRPLKQHERYQWIIEESLLSKLKTLQSDLESDSGCIKTICTTAVDGWMLVAGFYDDKELSIGIAEAYRPLNMFRLKLRADVCCSINKITGSSANVESTKEIADGIGGFKTLDEPYFYLFGTGTYRDDYKDASSVSFNIQWEITQLWSKGTASPIPKAKWTQKGICDSECEK